MAGFVPEFEQDVTDEEDGPVGGSDCAVEAGDKGAPVRREGDESRDDEGEPSEEAEAIEKRTQDWLDGGEDAVGIEEGDAEVHEADGLAYEFLFAAVVAAGEELLGFGRDVDLEKVCAVELAEDGDNVVLGEGFVAVAGEAELPGFIDGA